MPVRDVTDEDFADAVLGSDRPVLVDFWTESCGPCRMLAPVLEDLAASQHTLAIVKLDVRKNPKTVGEYAVSSIPTLGVYANGALVRTMVGIRSRAALVAELADYLK